MEKFKGAIDFTTKQVGCALLQPVYGGDKRITQIFPVELWALAPTDNMVVVEGTREQWEFAARKWMRERNERYQQNQG